MHLQDFSTYSLVLYQLVIYGVVGGVLSLLFFGWVYAKGAFNDPDAQALLIFDDMDLRLSRPWETPQQKAERELRYGPLLPVSLGEWGGVD